LRKLSDRDLVRCGIRRKKEDHFRIDPDLKLISERIGKEVPAAQAFIVDMEKLAKALKKKEEEMQAEEGFCRPGPVVHGENSG